MWEEGDCPAWESRRTWRRKERAAVPMLVVQMPEVGYGAGAWSSNTAYSTTRRRLYRNPDDKMLGGVISGMAAYLGWDVTLLRLLLLVV